MKKLVIIGANYLQLPLVEKANKMGLETHVFAWEKGAIAKEEADYFYPISIVEKDQILKKCKEINPDGITSIASDLAVPTINYIANRLGLLSNPPESTKASTNKFEMRKKLAQQGINIPKYTLYRNNEFKIKNNFEFPIIIKPTDRSGSRGVTKVNDPKELINAYKRAKNNSFNNQIIIEQYINGKEISVEMVSWNGEHYYLNSTDKETTGEPYFVEIGQHQPSNLSKKLKNRVIDITKKSLDALGIKYGASHTEIKIDENNKLFIIEVGARMGGDFIGSHLVRLSTGYDFLQSVIDISLENFTRPKINKRKYSGVFYLNPKPGIVANIVDNSSDYYQVIDKEIKYKIGDKVNNIKESSDRKGYILYKSNNQKFRRCKEKIIKVITK